MVFTVQVFLFAHLQKVSHTGQDQVFRQGNVEDLRPGRNMNQSHARPVAHGQTKHMETRLYHMQTIQLGRTMLERSITHGTRRRVVTVYGPVGRTDFQPEILSIQADLLRQQLQSCGDQLCVFHQRYVNDTVCSIDSHAFRTSEEQPVECLLLHFTVQPQRYFCPGQLIVRIIQTRPHQDVIVARWKLRKAYPVVVFLQCDAVCRFLRHTVSFLVHHEHRSVGDLRGDRFGI